MLSNLWKCWQFISLRIWNAFYKAGSRGAEYCRQLYVMWCTSFTIYFSFFRWSITNFDVMSVIKKLIFLGRQKSIWLVTILYESQVILQKIIIDHKEQFRKWNIVRLSFSNLVVFSFMWLVSQHLYMIICGSEHGYNLIYYIKGEWHEDEVAFYWEWNQCGIAWDVFTKK